MLIRASSGSSGGGGVSGMPKPETSVQDTFNASASPQTITVNGLSEIYYVMYSQTSSKIWYGMGFKASDGTICNSIINSNCAELTGDYGVTDISGNQFSIKWDSSIPMAYRAYGKA